MLWLLQLLGQKPIDTTPEAFEDSRRQRYERARRAQVEQQRSNSPRALAVLQANALSFTAILVLLLVVNQTGVVGW